MQIQVTGHHIDVTDAMKSYLEEKSEKLKRHFDQVMNIHFILTIENQSQIAEATLHSAGHDLFAKADGDDMYKSMDAVIDKLDRQIKKFREKETSYR